MSNEYQDWKRDEIFELKQELIRTRKALDVAVDALKKTLNGCESYDADYGVCYTALEQITALEQKDENEYAHTQTK